MFDNDQFELMWRTGWNWVVTFSIANSSSALILISRAFSWASCLMNATYRFCKPWRREKEHCVRPHNCVWSFSWHTILFISLMTSSSFSAREDMICVFVVANVKESLVSWLDLEALPKMVIFPAKRRQGMLDRFLALASYEHLVLTCT